MARRRVVAACDGLCEERRDVAELLISELVANAVRHPPRGGAGPDIAIIVRIHRTDRLLRIEVQDHDGRPLPAVRPPPAPRESGMGLQLVSQLATTWGISDARTGDGKTVWFELRLAG
jgi:anti-sigma regulatory factor (Ser/Thr protein kinase)